MIHAVRLTLPEGFMTCVMAYPEGWVVRELDPDGFARQSHLVPAGSLLYVNGEHRPLPELPRAPRRHDDEDEDDDSVLTHDNVKEWT